MTIHGALATLVNAGLLTPGEDAVDPALTFRHSLLHDAAYASLLRAERRTLHLLTARVLESLVPPTQPDRLAILAGHFDRGGAAGEARRYHLAAGRQAAARFATPEALSLLRRAHELAGATEVETEELLEIYTSLGHALETSGGFRTALELYEELALRGHDRGDPRIELAARMAQAKVRATPNPEQDPDQAIDLLDDALNLARRTADAASESRVLWNRMLVGVYAGGDIDQAIRDGLQSLELAQQEGLEEQTAFSWNDLGYAYTAADRHADALDSLERAASMWRRLDNRPMLADSLGASVVPCHHLGQFDRALQAAEEALAVSTSIGNTWGQANSRFWVSHVLFDRGRPGDAIRAIRDGVDWGTTAGHVVVEYVGLADLGWIYGSLGALEDGLAMADRVLERLPPVFADLVLPHVHGVLSRLRVRAGDLTGARRALAAGEGRMPPQGLRLLAPYHLAQAAIEIHLAAKDPEAALAAAETYLGYLGHTQADGHRPEALFLKAVSLREAGRLRESFVPAEEGFTMARRLGLVRLLGPLARELSSIFAELGDDEKASAWSETAGAAFESIAAHIPSASLQAIFLTAIGRQSPAQSG